MLLNDFPRVDWNLCHFGRSKEVMSNRFDLGAKYPNMYIDTSGSGIERVGMLELAAEKMGTEKILFGSDFPINEPGQSMTRIHNAFLSENDKKGIFRNNLYKLLKKHGASL